MTQLQTLAPRTACRECRLETEAEVVIDYISNNRLSGEEDLTEGDRAEIKHCVEFQLENETGSFCSDHWMES